MVMYRVGRWLNPRPSIEIKYPAEQHQSSHPITNEMRVSFNLSCQSLFLLQLNLPRVACAAKSFFQKSVGQHKEPIPEAWRHM